MHHPTQDNTYHGLCYTGRGALAGTRNSWPLNERENLLPPLQGLFFPISSKGYFICNTPIQDSTYHDFWYTSLAALAGTRNNSMGTPLGINPTTHCTMSRLSTTLLHLAPCLKLILSLSHWGFLVDYTFYPTITINKTWYKKSVIKKTLLKRYKTKNITYC